ncbi:D-aminoacid aminotransferase-like PLP-dependent enzyme [Martensiomyces pterosporus]|nr:D-aminoacid aminotransferase-like PLP-dependent enzyme [Martensiomyces pterosporus]
MLPDIAAFQILETTLYTKSQGIWLLESHLARMKQSAKLLRKEYGSASSFPCDSVDASEIIRQAKAKMAPSPDTDYRVRMLLSSCGSLEIQVTPEAPHTDSPPPLLVLDQQPTDTQESVFVKCKTTHRDIYTSAASRIPAKYPPGTTQVLLYNTRNEITEGNIANVAIGLPDKQDGSIVMATPPLESGLLPGTVRDDLIKRGEIVERVVTVDQFRDAIKNGWPVMCMNSVRGLYKVTPVIHGEQC